MSIVDDLLLTRTGSVYTRTGTGGFTTLATSTLACGLLHLNQQPGPTSSARAELAAHRRLVFDVSYDMPEGAQIVIDGIRWQVLRRTIETIPGIGIGGSLSAAYKRAYVQRVDT